jgi:hypothetical protein
MIVSVPADGSYSIRASSESQSGLLESLNGCSLFQVLPPLSFIPEVRFVPFRSGTPVPTIYFSASPSRSLSSDFGSESFIESYVHGFSGVFKASLDLCCSDLLIGSPLGFTSSAEFSTSRRFDDATAIKNSNVLPNSLLIVDTPNLAPTNSPRVGAETISISVKGLETDASAVHDMISSSDASVFHNVISASDATVVHDMISVRRSLGFTRAFAPSPSSVSGAHAPSPSRTESRTLVIVAGAACALAGCAALALLIFWLRQDKKPSEEEDMSSDDYDSTFVEIFGQPGESPARKTIRGH